MLSHKIIKSRLLEKEKEITKNVEPNQMYGFWDKHKDKLVYRVFGGRLITKTKHFALFQEVLRYYPEKYKQKIEYKNRTGKIISKTVEEKIWVTEFFREPYGYNFSYSTTYDGNSNNMIVIRRNKTGGIYKNFLKYHLKVNEDGTLKKEEDIWYFYRNNFVPNPYIKDITKLMLNESDLNKIKNHKLEIKTSLNLLELLENGRVTDTISLRELNQYLSLYKEYSGLRYFWKNDIFYNINKSLLQRLNKDKKMKEWYMNIARNDRNKLSKINSVNVKKVFNGEDIDTITREQRFMFIFWLAARERWGTYNKTEKKYMTDARDPKRKDIVKTIRQYIREIPMFKNDYIEQTKMGHYIDYLEVKTEHQKISKGIVVNKDWEKEYERIQAKRKKEDRKKWIKENEKIEKAIKEIAFALGIKETEIKKGDQTEHVLFKAPKSVLEMDDFGNELNHCYANNNYYLTRHNNLQNILIFIEKEGKPYATATLHPDGKISQVHLKGNLEVEPKEKKQFKEIILTEFLPNLLKLKKEREVI